MNSGHRACAMANFIGEFGAAAAAFLKQLNDDPPPNAGIDFDQSPAVPALWTSLGE
jgi:hypothetical protein